MIEIINGSPLTLETFNLALLSEKINKESKVSLRNLELIFPTSNEKLRNILLFWTN